MTRWLAGVAVLLCSWCLPTDVHAGGLPVKLLSKSRLGPICAKSEDTNIALDCWLKQHQMIALSMQYHDGNFNDIWNVWPAPVKQQFRVYFNQMIVFYTFGMPPNFPQPLPTPLPRQGPPVPAYGGYGLSETDGRTAYLLLVANNLAAELTAAFPWSIQTYGGEELNILLSMPQLIGTRVAPPLVPTAGYFSVFDSPATPAYTLSFFKKNQLLGPTALDTIARLVGWERQLEHYYVEEGTSITDLEALFWGPITPPISESQLIEGTIYTGPSGPTFGHYTAGCHGTMQFMKVALQAVNIPVKIWSTENHATPFFPTVDRALSHGDDPYNGLGRVTAFQGFPVPSLTQFLPPASFVTNLCDPNWPDPSWCQHKVGIVPAYIGITYGSDRLMKMHCKDLAAGKPHADSSVLELLKWYWPEKTLAEVQLDLENNGMWTLLDAKVAATKFCS